MLTLHLVCTQNQTKTGDCQCLENVVQLISRVVVLSIVGHSRVSGDQGVLRADVQGVVNLPIHITDFASGVEQTLKEVNRKGLIFLSNQKHRKGELVSNKICRPKVLVFPNYQGDPTIYH